MAKGPMGNNAKYLSSILGVGIQKKTHPKLETIMEHLITDPNLKNGLQRILDVLKENNAEPAWFTTSHYRFKHNEELIFQIKFGDGFKYRDNEVEIRVLISPVRMERFEEFLTGEMRDVVTELMKNRSFKICNGCSPCGKRQDFEYKGKQYKHVCTAPINMMYLLFSHTPNLSEQFQTIEKWIKAIIIFNNAIRTV